MAIEWSFPSNNFGTLNGIGEAGIETFKGAPYRSLAREICQNSLDARLSKQKPVRVIFSLSSINSREIPRFEELKEALSRCLSFWKEQGNEKTIAFFKEATTIAAQSSLDLLRISDFNTTGLTGSDKRIQQSLAGSGQSIWSIQQRRLFRRQLWYWKVGTFCMLEITDSFLCNQRYRSYGSISGNCPLGIIQRKRVFQRS